MRILVLSDVHANLEALEACLDAAPAHDLAVNLGDVVGYGGSPNEVIDRVCRECRLHIRGNHDKACAGLTDVEGFNPIAAYVVSWTRLELTPEHIEWLRAMPSGPLTLPEAEHVRFAHGSVLDEDEYVVGIDDAMEPLMLDSTPITFFGHTHLQGGFSLYNDSASDIHPQIDPGSKLDRSELQLVKSALYLLNPGSVGQPRDGDWRAGFALFDTELSTVTFYRVPYDVATAQQRIRSAALPERLAMRLSIGR